jgi:hypothetical protein
MKRCLALERHSRQGVRFRADDFYYIASRSGLQAGVFILFNVWKK